MKYFLEIASGCIIYATGLTIIFLIFTAMGA